jgi:MFS family permease
MTRGAAQADRNAAVRAAARGWKQAGAIDDAALAAVAAAWPDDRHRLGPVFRVLVFLFTLISVNGALGFVGALIDFESETLPFLLLVFGSALIVVTDVQLVLMRRRQGGTEAATSLVGIGYLVGFAFWNFDQAHWKSNDAVTATLFVAAFLLAIAAWRWGYPLYAGAAMAALLGSLTALPSGRLLWIVLTLLAAPLLARLAESARLPPAHRDSCRIALGVALAGLYLAVNLYSFDWGIVEFRFLHRPPSALRGWSIAATALVPIVYLALGLRSRRWVFLILGLGTAIASLVTLRWYVHLAPLWVVLTVSGGALVAAVFALRRYLDSGPEKERHGFTAEPLFEDLAQRRMLEAGAAVMSLSPEARPVHEEPKFAGGGGEFGGGGSSSEF